MDLPNYCQNNGPNDYMDEFPIYVNIGGQQSAPYCRREPLTHRVIFQTTWDATANVWELRYCGVAYHKDGGGHSFTGC